MCAKIGYKSKTEALRVRQSLRRFYLQPYRCPECRGKVWHMGHQPMFQHFNQWMKGGEW